MMNFDHFPSLQLLLKKKKTWVQAKLLSLNACNLKEKNVFGNICINSKPEKKDHMLLFLGRKENVRVVSLVVS